MVYCVGLTGSLASGKTTAAKIFSDLGIDVIDADKISKDLTQKNRPAYYEIVEHYGDDVLNTDKELNRAKLREIIFSNSKERYWLEQLLHPLIRQEMKQKVDSSTSAYCIVEIPLLLTKQDYPYINRVLLINAPTETQISRVMQRDQCSKNQALSILSTQPNINLRLKNADDVIINNKGLDDLTENIENLHHKYLEKSKPPNGLFNSKTS